MAGLIPQYFIDDLLTRIDIVDVIDGYVPLKRAGRNHMACCPFHNEKTPSFTVSQEKQFYHCFGCGANGSAIGFLMEHAGMTFPEAIEDLASRAGVEVVYEGGGTAARPAEDKSDLYELMELAVRYYSRQLREHPQREQAVAYLKKRGLTGEIANEFEIGFAPSGWDNLLGSLGKSPEAIKRLASIGLLVEKDGAKGHYDRFRERVMFPIRDRRGRAIGFGGRVLGDGEPKYLNSPETPIFHKGQEAYGLYQARKALRDMERIYVVEGYMDVVALAQAGVRNAVATLGTTCTREHLESMFRNAAQVVFCFDGDSAGQKAAFRAMETALPLLREGREIAFLFLPGDDDPDTFIRREGASVFTDPARLTMLSDYLFGQLRSDIDTSSLEGKARFEDKVYDYLNKLPAGSLRDQYEQKVSNIVGRDVNELRRKHQVEDHPGRNSRPLLHSNDSRKAPSLVGHMIALLVQSPALAQEIDDPAQIARIDLPGVEFLVELLEFIRQRPQVNTAGIVEHWRDSKYERRIRELASTDLGSHALMDQKAEFRDAVTRLLKLYRRQRLQVLRQLGWNELTEAQKQELKNLT
ncbi:MAG: DNA primase, partial [Gammaproteobacteria bacterium]